MAKDKVLGTTLFVYHEMLTILRECGYQGENRQFRLICKCKSVADANRKCEAAGLGEKVFRPGWYSVTSNKVELNVCETTDIAIGFNQMGKTYISIEEIQEKRHN